MSATEALAFLRSLPTADDRALAARPLLDLLKAPGNTAVAGWSILIQLIQALEPDLPLRTILDIARSQETRANGDITGNDLDSLPSLSPMLRETIPGADGALLRLHLPRMIKRWARQAGLLAEICAHSFRGTGITEYLRNGSDLEVGARIAGQESTRTRNSMNSIIGSRTRFCSTRSSG